MEESPQKHGAFTRHYESSLFQVTKMGMFSVEMVVREHDLRTGVNTVDLILHDKNDKDVIGARIEVTPWMPDMGHGVFEKPSVKEKGGGLYTVENIILTMSGRWELRVSVTADGMKDSAAFDFPDVKVDRGHDHKMVESPTDLDLSTEKLTEHGEFRVSYKSSAAPVPINMIHTWQVRLKTPDGSSVSGAHISLDGDMPEHGHGLPTEPEVSEGVEQGLYLVEGIKFSMPGWWVMKFNIKSANKADSVTFNLLLKE